MFRKLIDQFRPKHLKDPTFGDLRFMKMKHPSTSYWEGRGLFEPVGVEIEYLTTVARMGRVSRSD